MFRTLSGLFWRLSKINSKKPAKNFEVKQSDQILAVAIAAITQGVAAASSLLTQHWLFMLHQVGSD